MDYRKRWDEQAPINIDGAVVEQVESFHVPWRPHHQRTIMVQTHQDSHEEDTTKPIPPQETKKIWSLVLGASKCSKTAPSRAS